MYTLEWLEFIGDRVDRGKCHFYDLDDSLCYDAYVVVFWT